MISLLLEFGADISLTCGAGRSALILAAGEGRVESVRLLVENGARVNQVDRAECCALIHAVRTGHLAISEYLLTCDWIAVSEQDLGLAEAAQQAVVAAAYAGHTLILEFLLDMAEVRVDSADTLMAETPLCAAAGAGNTSCCEILVRRGASVGATNLKGVSPLHIAGREGHYGVCDILIREGASTEQEDSMGRTPVIEAAMHGHTGTLELLIAKKAQVEKKDNDNLTALLWACAKGKLESAKCLLSQGADINHKDSKGRTALDLAASYGDAYLVQYLLEQGARMENVDISGVRPLDRAISCGNSDVVKCFLKKGAKLGPSTWAMASGKPYILLTLLNKLLEDGNTLYKRNKLAEAAQRYQYAAKRVPSMEQGAHNKKVFDQLKTHALLNLSRCKRKMLDYSQAVKVATEVLASQPSCYQAFHARAKAHHAAGHLHQALQDLTEAVRVAPQNRELHKILLTLKEEIHSQSVTDQEKSGENNSSSQVSPSYKGSTLL
jgi:ankyrin repeat protein